MFDQTLKAEVKRIETLVPKVDGPVQKVCRVTFRRDLNEDIARSLGGDFGLAALEQLDDRGITQVVFPIDSVAAHAKLVGDKGEAIEIAQVTGIKAVAKAKKLQEDKEPDKPSVELKFQFVFSADVWLFFGKNACGTIDVTLSKRQLSLPLAERKPDEGKPGGKKRKAKPDEQASAGEPKDVGEQKVREERMLGESVWPTRPVA